jgi:hypothetical protein
MIFTQTTTSHFVQGLKRIDGSRDCRKYITCDEWQRVIYMHVFVLEYV